ncbi:Centrosomal Protein Of 97 Kda [Manis pentadactyla]|nr:Centrosomal Protein Of 97 Kda [Manis pentadactyla]
MKFAVSQAGTKLYRKFQDFSFNPMTHPSSMGLGVHEEAKLERLLQPSCEVRRETLCPTVPAVGTDFSQN